MKLQGRNLSLNMQGTDVALLHTELSQLGFAVPAAEIAGQLYGPGTQQVVTSFQQQHGLPTTGAVDASTATQINAEVVKLPTPRVTGSATTIPPIGPLAPGSVKSPPAKPGAYWVSASKAP